MSDQNGPCDSVVQSMSLSHLTRWRYSCSVGGRMMYASSGSFSFTSKRVETIWKVRAKWTTFGKGGGTWQFFYLYMTTRLASKFVSVYVGSSVSYVIRKCGGQNKLWEIQSKESRCVSNKCLGSTSAAMTYSLISKLSWVELLSLQHESEIFLWYGLSTQYQFPHVHFNFIIPTLEGSVEHTGDPA